MSRCRILVFVGSTQQHLRSLIQEIQNVVQHFCLREHILIIGSDFGGKYQVDRLSEKASLDSIRVSLYIIVKDMCRTATAYIMSQIKMTILLKTVNMPPNTVF
jgi:hypothetical protein